MRVHYRNFVATGTSPATEIIAAYEGLTGKFSPHVLCYTPVARLNPFQNLIYREFNDSGIAVAPVLRPDRFRNILDVMPLGQSMSLHLHWNSWMTFNQVDEAKARTMGMGMVERLVQLRNKGVNVIWTVHNLYPHDAKHVGLELEIQQKIADAANIVHVMSKSTVASMSGLLDLDSEKVIHVPHPNYKGAYIDTVTRNDARVMLGIEPEEVVFLLFGAIKKYKGLERLLEAIDILMMEQPQLRFRLVVAGASDGTPTVSDFIEKCLVHPRILIDPSMISGERAQYFLRAADIGLVNYERMLNSGAALLYGTFGLPVVAADIPSLREGLDPISSIFVQDITSESFASALLKAAEQVDDMDKLNSLKSHISQFDPNTVSKELSSRLLERI